MYIPSNCTSLLYEIKGTETKGYIASKTDQLAFDLIVSFLDFIQRVSSP